MSSYPELKGRVCVVTGAGGNLGSAVIERLHGEGMRFVLVERKLDRLQALQGQLGMSDTDCLLQSADITQRPAVEALVSAAVAAFGRIDALVNVAGSYRGGQPVHALDEQTWDFLFDLNAKSVFLVSGAVAKTMVDGGIPGRIVTVASRSGTRGEANNASYAASKAAAIRLMDSMAAELIKHGINVNSVLPSVIDTPQNREGAPEASIARWVKPESIAEVIAFLLSDAARDISGASIPVYGRA